MTTVSILPVPRKKGVSYRAIAGDKQSEGRSVGEALDALTVQLSDEESGTMVIVQNFRPDRFFTAQQRNRLAELMVQWREARESGSDMPEREKAEMDALVDAELEAATKRAAMFNQPMP